MEDITLKTVKSVMPHFNYIHCEVETLSMSKRITNKVFSCADDCNVKMYYQYTDPTHVKYGDVERL